MRGPTTRAEKLVLILLGLSMIGWFASVRQGEIYPLVSLPSFRGVPDASAVSESLWEYQFTNPDGSQGTVGVDAVLDGIQSSQWRGLLARSVHFSDDAEVVEWSNRLVAAAVGEPCVEDLTLEFRVGDDVIESASFDVSCNE